MERDQALTGTVALLGLSGAEADLQRVFRARSYFERMGFKVLLAPDSTKRTERFSGTDQERLDSLKEILRVSDLRIVIGLRGGYGLSRLLGRIDFDAIGESIRDRGVHWVGQSDWTALHLGLLAKSGEVSLAGPLAAHDFGGETPDAFTAAHFWSAIRREPVEFDWVADAPAMEIEGTLWGGNLAMLCSLIGTPYFPTIDRGILFLEDVNEHPYRIERMLLQLNSAGILARQQAVLLGDFSGYKLTDYDQGYDLASAIEHVRGASATPLIEGLPFGHGARKLTLPVGARFMLRTAGGGARLAQMR